MIDKHKSDFNLQSVELQAARRRSLVTGLSVQRQLTISASLDLPLCRVGADGWVVWNENTGVREGVLWLCVVGAPLLLGPALTLALELLVGAAKCKAGGERTVDTSNLPRQRWIIAVLSAQVSFTLI